MQRVRYIGRVKALFGKTGIAKNSDKDKNYYSVQFDDLSLGVQWTHTWTNIRKDRLEVIEATPMPSGPLFIQNIPKAKKPKEWEPDSINPELLTKRLREW